MLAHIAFEFGKKASFFAKRDRGLLQRTRYARTFAGRAVFSPPHMSPEKMIEFSFTAPAVKLYEVF